MIEVNCSIVLATAESKKDMLQFWLVEYDIDKSDCEYMKLKAILQAIMALNL